MLKRLFFAILFFLPCLSFAADRSSLDSAVPSTNVYFGNLPLGYNGGELADLATPFGKILSTQVFSGKVAND